MLKHLVITCAAVALLAGCAAGGGARNTTAEDGRLAVYASFYPMADFAAKVGGDKVNVTNMTPAGSEPHDWEPTPADIAGLAGADVFIYNGAGLEHWVEAVLTSLNTEKPMIVCASDGVELLGGGEATDPHVWLSVSNAKKEMENIKNALVSADPEGASYYEANFERWAKEFDALDKTYVDAAASFSSRDIVVSHAAFGYMCRDYGLNQVGIEGLAPHSEPDPATMAEVIGYVRDNGVKVIFLEEYASSKVSDIIAVETGASVDVLSIVEGLTDEELAAGEDYLTVMRRNLAALQKALGKR